MPTVTVAKGGTGLTSFGTALQVLRVNAGATALEYAAAGSGLTAIASHDILANITGSSAVPVANTLSDTIDAAFTGSAQGTSLFRGSSGWTVLAPGPSTYVLSSQGASADLHWIAPQVGGSGASPANTYIVQTTAADCANAQVLGVLASGILKNANTTGILSIAGGADLPLFTASGAGHHAGAVPDPGGSAATTHFLREDATWQIPPGTVSSVAMTVPGTIYGIAGSPVTTSGTLALSLLTQNANVAFVGPATGAAAVPTFRALAGADLPATGLTITEWVNGITGATVTGTLPRRPRRSIAPVKASGLWPWSPARRPRSRSAISQSARP